MKIGDMDTGAVGVKTVKTSNNTIYAVVSEKKGLQLSIKVRIAPIGIVGQGFMTLDSRIRIAKLEDWANLEEGPEVFGFPEATRKSSSYMSRSFSIVICKLPQLPSTILAAIEDNQLITRLLAFIKERVMSAGADFLPSLGSLRDFTLEPIRSSLPAFNTPVYEEFPIISEEKLSATLLALVEKSGAKSNAKAPEGSESAPKDAPDSPEGPSDGDSEEK